jgi:hypothetical protein
VPTLLSPVGEARPAFGVTGGEQNASEQAHVLEELGTVERPLVRVGPAPEGVSRQSGRYQRAGEQERPQSPPLAAGQRKTADDLRSSVDAYQVRRIFRNDRGDLLRGVLLDQRNDTVGHGFRRRHQGIRIPNGFHAVDDEIGSEHGARASA